MKRDVDDLRVTYRGQLYYAPGQHRNWRSHRPTRGEPFEIRTPSSLPKVLTFQK
jgi:hypothetical protein